MNLRRLLTVILFVVFVMGTAFAQSDIITCTESDFVHEDSDAYIYKDGKMLCDAWVFCNDEWYFTKSDGKIATNEWLTNLTRTYFAGENGKIKRDCTETINGIEYTFNSLGASDPTASEEEIENQINVRNSVSLEDTDTSIVAEADDSEDDDDSAFDIADDEDEDEEETAETAKTDETSDSEDVTKELPKAYFTAIEKETVKQAETSTAASTATSTTTSTTTATKEASATDATVASTAASTSTTTSTATETETEKAATSTSVSGNLLSSAAAVTLQDVADDAETSEEKAEAEAATKTVAATTETAISTATKTATATKTSTATKTATATKTSTAVKTASTATKTATKTASKTTSKTSSLKGKTLKVLMIGNSKTYFNNLPTMVEKFVNTAYKEGKSDFKVEVEQFAFNGSSGDAYRTGGFTLKKIYNRHTSKIKAKLTEKKWDYIILQPGSTEVFKKSEMKSSFNLYYDIAKKKNSDVKFLIYVMNLSTTYRYARIAEAVKAEQAAVKECKIPSSHIKLAYASLAFKEIYDKTKSWKKIIRSDKNHPTVAGSYLISCVIFAALTGKTPVGVSYAGKLTKSDVSLSKKDFSGAKGTRYCTSATHSGVSDKAYYQKIAWTIEKDKDKFNE